MPFLTQLFVDYVIQVVDVAKHLFLIEHMCLGIRYWLVPGRMPRHAIDRIVLSALSRLIAAQQATGGAVLALLHN